MIDSKGVKITLNQIVQYKNFETKEVDYFYVDTSNFGYMWLFKYNNKGNINKDGFGNIKVDPGISLLNNETGEWTILGTKEEIYNKIFKK